MKNDSKSPWIKVGNMPPELIDMREKGPVTQPITNFLVCRNKSYFVAIAIISKSGDRKWIYEDETVIKDEDWYMLIPELPTKGGSE